MQIQAHVEVRADTPTSFRHPVHCASSHAGEVIRPDPRRAVCGVFVLPPRGAASDTVYASLADCTQPNRNGMNRERHTVNPGNAEERPGRSDGQPGRAWTTDAIKTRRDADGLRVKAGVLVAGAVSSPNRTVYPLTVKPDYSQAEWIRVYRWRGE